MVTATAAFPGRPFQLRLESWLVSQDIPGNRSLIHWEHWIDKLAYSPTYNNSAVATWSVNVNNSQAGAGGPSPFDFRAAGPWLQGSGDSWVGHPVDGSAVNPPVQAWANYGALGSAYCVLWIMTPRIPRGPRVFTGGGYRHSVAYIYTGGGWRIGIPYVKTGGNWLIGGG